jgi:hypothetical protein
MGGYATAIMTTLVLTGLFSYILIRTDIDAIKSDWANRRCEFPVMVMAGLLNPPQSGKTAMEYATDNFSFCTQKGIQDVLKLAFAPLYAVMGQQTNVMGSLAGPMNSIRASLKNTMKKFASLMDTQMRRYNLVSASILKTWNHLLFSFGRIQSIFYSIVYFGLSMNAMIQNTLDLTYRAVLVFIGIMVAMIILLFFVLFPFIPLILTTITVLVAVGVGGASGMAGAFCINPDATVILADGSKKSLRTVNLGDKLATASATESENIVTGILEADATRVPLVSIEGVLMSESHRVQNAGNWILAKEHPDAKKQPGTLLPQLICLNTTAHEVIIETESGNSLPVGDWEEVSDDEGRKAWIDAVQLSLNQLQIPIEKYPTAPPLVSPSTLVIDKHRGLVPIASILIGDFIKGSNGLYTRVNGIYRGYFKAGKPNSPDWISDGVWVQDGQRWTTASSGLGMADQGELVKGVFLITEDETFVLQMNGDKVLVRDFTEIGARQIDQTYEMLEAHMNKK